MSDSGQCNRSVRIGESPAGQDGPATHKGLINLPNRGAEAVAARAELRAYWDTGEWAHAYRLAQLTSRGRRNP